MSKSVIERWGVYGHDWAVEHLQRSIINGRVRHAYLIIGAESVGKRRLAQSFARALNCLHEDAGERPCGECRICLQILSGNHADVLYSQTDSTTGALKVEEIRAVTSRIALKPFDARYRVAIFEDFDHAQPRAQDALLKTLEEPPPHAVLILLAESLEGVLPTITSRSQPVHLRPAPAREIAHALMNHYHVEEGRAALLANLSGGRMGWAIRAAEDETLLEQRTHALDLLEAVLTNNRNGRFSLADDLAKERLALPPLLELWQSYWRDALHLAAGSEVRLANRDRTEGLRQLVSMISREEIEMAMQATQTMMRTLDSNANARLALEVMFLDYPGLHRGE
jgi:DNA polymerase-3 subunit delta'